MVSATPADAALTSQWRGFRPVDVSRDLLLLPQALCEFRTCLSERGNPNEMTEDRLLLYYAGQDDLIPKNWLQVLLRN